jgi:hypothetical protein
LEKDPAADRAFVKLARKFVILHFDTSNGRAPHVDRLKVKRNQTYALVLRPDGTEIDRIEKPIELKPMVTLMKKALKEKRPLDENPTRL